MKDSQKVSGKCLCGAVELRAVVPDEKVEACHCSMCRKWGGGPFIGFTTDQVTIAGEENVAIFDSSEWAERTFCKHCGTHLFYKMKGKDMYSVAAGFFSDLSDVELSEEIYIDSKPHYYSFAQNTEQLTEQQVLEKYASLVE